MQRNIQTQVLMDRLRADHSSLMSKEAADYIERLERALEPFAKAAELLPADGRLDKEMIWAPAQGRIIYGKHFRAAQDAFGQ